MSKQNIPTMTCACPGTFEYHPTLTATGTSDVADDTAWTNLEHDMPGGQEIMAFFVSVARALPATCGGDCGKPQVTTVGGATGYSGSATRNKKTGVTTWTYDWVLTLDVTIKCSHPAAVQPSTGRPKLEPVEVAGE